MWRHIHHQTGLETRHIPARPSDPSHLFTSADRHDDHDPYGASSASGRRRICPDSAHGATGCPQAEDPHAEDPVPQAGTEELEMEGSAAGPADIGAAPMDSVPRTPAGPNTTPTLQSLQAEITDMGQTLTMIRQEQAAQRAMMQRA